nr:helix-turn-helix domain-containing protein [Caulobacter sp. 17J80-11]
MARQSGVPASTLRFYEEKGLIASTGRRGRKRLFAPSTLERLSLIGLGRTSGFSLEEIARMIGGPSGPKIDKAQLGAKAEELDRRIEHLTRMRDGLRHAAACSAPSLTECPRFVRIVATVGRKSASRRARNG